jgi:hypothetical protein
MLKFSKKTTRAIAMTFAVMMLTDTAFPVAAYALTGGPSQPEVQGFTPIGTSDMVDLFSGDFSYNIPLIDMDGYPLNLAYQSGVTMDAEASWVGLGWSLNPGVINRNMRGVPDDFRGDEMTREFKMKDNKTFGAKFGAGTELFGSDMLGVNINASVGVNFNNYNGVGIERNLSLSISSGEAAKFKGNASLGINSSSDNGLSIQPSAGAKFTHKVKANSEGTSAGSLGLSIGTSFNSRAGLSQLSISSNITPVPAILPSMQNAFGTSSVFSFGSYSYTPSIDFPMHNLSISGNFKVGGELFGLAGTFDVGGYFSSQKLMYNTISNPAYGYMYYDEGVRYDNSTLDFNRENDRGFVQDMPALPMSNLTYDIYSVSGQGIGGSYRPFRSDVGYVYDPTNYTTSDGYSIGAEFGLGNLTHNGVDFSINSTLGQSGRWTDDNAAESKLRYHGSAYEGYEPFYFKEANEKSVESDPAFQSAYGNGDAQRFEIDGSAAFNAKLTDELKNSLNVGRTIPGANHRAKRDKRNQTIYQLTRKEVNDGFGLEDAHPDQYNSPEHHIAEITTYGNDAMRYVYGIAAYNTLQKDVTFAVGKPLYNGSEPIDDCASGLVPYNPGVDNSLNNDKGLDNFYSANTTPAFAHSYLLTAVLSPDYIDADHIKGPSVGDLGYYTKFYYSEVENYKWRIPFEQNMANYNEGLKTDKHDDKASYMYGEKDLWYVDSIVSKNYIAIFHTEARKDAWGVIGENGGIETNQNKASRLLRKISLYSIWEYRANGVNAVPLKEVHFEYDYSLCPNVPNNNGQSEMVNNVDLNANRGKLTLKKVYFTYQNSNKAKLSPYVFTYSNFNPNYNLKGYDRWSNYKPNTGSCAPNTPGLTAPEFPYVLQDQASADQYTSAWSMTEVKLPSGGKIKVTYESDDYAYVQHKQAMQMFKIIGTSYWDNQTNQYVDDLTNGQESRSLSNSGSLNHALLVELPAGFSGTITELTNGIGQLYFRCLMNFGARLTDDYDYVSGYAQIDPAHTAITNLTSSSGNPVARIGFQPVTLRDADNTPDYNPIVKAAIQFGRLNLSRYVWTQPNGLTGDETFGQNVISAIIGSSFVNNIADAIKGPNKALYDAPNHIGTELYTYKSWIRLNNPNHKKLGGGSRVKRIELSDEFAAMTGNAMSSFQYGQEYDYTLEDGSSSGVASYEPQLGGDENPWRQPIAYSTEKLLAPDDEHYIEAPIGESYFPSASVGYSRVTVKNLSYSNVNRTATGKVVHEFYTAYDFPTIVDRTAMQTDQDKTDPFSITSLLYVNSKDYMTASQGFVVELNDMHGKQKKQMVYQEGQNVPITEVEYKYQSTPYSDVAGSGVIGGNNALASTGQHYRLNNDAKVIDRSGNISSREIGVFYDMAADMREYHNVVEGMSMQLNLDGFIIPPVPPVYVPMMWPQLNKEETQFRSATTTKIVQRFGILNEVIARDLGSVVNTENLAYDAETGELLETSVTTDYNDKVYNLTYPAHWYYDGMGQAYRNIGYSKTLVFASGAANLQNANLYFVPGDELALTPAIGNPVKGWVSAVNSSSVTVIDRAGNPVSGAYVAKVIRSGRRNLSSVPIATITTLSDPLSHFNQNIFANVLQASSMEFAQGWRTFCDCFDQDQPGEVATTNPYVLGTLGVWKMKRSLLHLTGRTQSNFNNNTNIRKDGVFTSYTPYYRLQNGSWSIDERDWTFTSEVTEFSPFGQELENRDALGRYSAATFGYRQTLPTGVAANARYRDIGSDNFEDYGFSPCADNHFKFDNAATNIVSTESHTGRNAIRVSAGTPVIMNRQLEICGLVECSLKLRPVRPPGQFTTTINIDNGTGPYQIEYNVLNGDPVVNIVPGAVTVDGTGWTIEIIVVDANGCKVSQVISYQ